jgi:hypothetical protein
MPVFEFSARIVPEPFTRAGRDAGAVALACVLLGACGPQAAESSESAGDATTTSASTDGGSGTTSDGSASDPTSGTTTGPEGPYVYKDEIVELEAPPPRGVFSLARCRAVGRS